MQHGFDAPSKSMASSRLLRLDVHQFRVSDAELEMMKGKVIVESSEIVDLGVASGAFEATDCVMVDESWIRISRPGLSSQTLEPLIFWAPDDETDNTPMESKIVGLLICHL